MVAGSVWVSHRGETVEGVDGNGMAQPIMSSGGNTITCHRGDAGRPLPALRESRPPSSASSRSGGGDDGNPFAPPPKDAPEQPWQPRGRLGGTAAHGGDPEAGEGSGTGRDGAGPQDGGRPAGGDRWSSSQPDPYRGGPGPFGGQGPGGGPGRPGFGARFDPSDPAQRQARYALLCGMWGLFFGLFNMPQVALLLGSLAVYWGISSLRAKPQAPKAARDQRLAAFGGPSQEPSAPLAAAGYGAGQVRPQFAAALGGLLAGVVALAITAAFFSLQLAYKNFYSCVNDALTQPARVACNDLLPPQLRPVLGVRN